MVRSSVTYISFSIDFYSMTKKVVKLVKENIYKEFIDKLNGGIDEVLLKCANRGYTESRIAQIISVEKEVDCEYIEECSKWYYKVDVNVCVLLEEGG